MSEVPPEIVALRRRLAELEQIADAHSAFNRALRHRAGKSPAEAEPETPSEPEPPAEVTRGVQPEPARQESFGDVLRRIRFGQ